MFNQFFVYFYILRFGRKVVKNKNQLYRWEKQVEAGGSTDDKFCDIKSFTFEKFMSAKSERLIIHDFDLRRWALQRSKALGLINFTGWFNSFFSNILLASHGWLHNFKDEHRIVSRKITHFVTTAHASDEHELSLKVDSFIDNAKIVMQNYANSDIYNTDQSGFNKELHGGRSLDFVGVKKVYGVVQSRSSTTHSYTIQVLALSFLYVIFYSRSCQKLAY